MHRFVRIVRPLAIAGVVVLAGSLAAWGSPTPVPFSAAGASFAELGARLDEATSNAIRTERDIEELRAENIALGERIKVTEDRLRAQQTELESAQVALEAATQRYGTHLVVSYKTGTVDPISLLLNADSIPDLMSRVSVLTRLAEEDARVVSDRAIAASNARYQAAVLDDLRAQDAELRRQQEERLRGLEDALASQQALVASLTDESKALLQSARKLDAETRARWRSSSIPVGTPIPRADATVDPYFGIAYRISAYMPRAYVSTGEHFSAVCSWYGNEFNGRGTASGQVFNEEDFTCASRTLPFGTILALTRGDRRIIAYVNDRGPFITGRDLDLSQAAASELGFSGVATVQAEIIVPTD